MGGAHEAHAEAHAKGQWYVPLSPLAPMHMKGIAQLWHFHSLPDLARRNGAVGGSTPLFAEHQLSTLLDPGVDLVVLEYAGQTSLQSAPTCCTCCSCSGSCTLTLACEPMLQSALISRHTISALDIPRSLHCCSPSPSVQ